MVAAWRLGDVAPKHFGRSFEPADNVLAGRLSGGIRCVAEADGHLLPAEPLDTDFTDDFTVVVVEIGLGVHELCGVARIRSKARLAVGDPLVVDKPGGGIAQKIVNNFVARNIMAVPLPSAKHDVTRSAEQWLYHRRYVAG